MEIQKKITIDVLQQDGTFEQKDILLNAWGMFVAIQRMPQIGRILVQPLSVMFAGMDKDQGMTMDNLPLALAMLFDELEANDIIKFFEMVCDGAYHEQEKLDVEKVCGNDLSALCHIAAENIMLNYGSLYKGKGLGLLAQAMTGMTRATMQQK